MKTTMRSVENFVIDSLRFYIRILCLPLPM